MARNKRQYFREEVDRAQNALARVSSHMLNVLQMFISPLQEQVENGDIPNDEYKDIAEAAALVLETLEEVDNALKSILENR